MLYNVTSTLDIRDTTACGMPLMHGYFKVRTDRVCIQTSGVYDLWIAGIVPESALPLVVMHYPTDGLWLSGQSIKYSLSRTGMLKLDLHWGDEVRFFYDDYSWWLHGAIVLLLKH